MRIRNVPIEHNNCDIFIVDVAVFIFGVFVFASFADVDKHKDFLLHFHLYQWLSFTLCEKHARILLACVCACALAFYFAAALARRC